MNWFLRLKERKRKGRNKMENPQVHPKVRKLYEGVILGTTHHYH
ncbi:hypothetical protein Hanom_Chr04g00300101 [Helianthus anomalus]